MIFHKRMGIGFLLLVLVCMECDDFQLVSAGEVRCVEREREALLRFKRGLVDDDGVLSSWGSEDTKKECCEWKGVVCGNTTHVIALVLGYHHFDFLPLGGKITDALIELHHLTKLDLSYNHFDQFPEFLGSMKQLEELNLRECFFNGTVPPQLGNLTNLQKLDLSHNSFRSDNLNWLSHLSLLTELDLSSSFDLSHTNWLQPILKLRSLQDLILRDSNIAGVAPARALSANSSSTPLSFLDLSDNKFTSSTLDWLFNISITTLRMTNNELDGPIPDVLGRLFFLEHLDLSGNMLDGEISKSLGNLSHLGTLYLYSNDYRGDFDALFGNQSTKVMMSLDYLDLSHNQLTGPLLGLKEFPALRSLHLRSNKFTGSMPESLSHLSELDLLDLSYNSLEGTISEAYFSKLHNLGYLDLSFNPLTLQISQEWSPPFQLRYLGLAGCNMSSSHFPQWIQTQRNIWGINLSYAGITDEIPEWLWSFSPRLDDLDISHNQISGIIPDLWSTSIINIDVSDNKFSGPVPLLPQLTGIAQFRQNMFSGSILSICAVPHMNLMFLDLSNNHLSGEIPNCWYEMRGLLSLNLGDNSFSGEIPHTLGNLLSLNSLHLRHNNLSGELPSTLKNCQKLFLIDVGGNNLTGNIPTWIATNKYLVYVILRHNKFYGGIPPQICSLTYVRVLDLSRNNISGEIPQCFHKFISLVEENTINPIVALSIVMTLGDSLNQLEYAFVQWKGGETEYRKILQHLKLIDLSSNRLRGSIPVSFSSMRELVSLNLSRNLLTGAIISNIGQMEMLEVLDLSRNQLSGDIPISLAQLHFLAVLDLANNHLSGKIPTSTQLQSFNASVYAGNDELCGLPLKLCSEDVPSPSNTDEGKNINKDGGIMSLSFMQEIGISIAFGFIVGFWGVVGSMVLKRSWRVAYFNLLDEAKDWFYNATFKLFRRSRRS